MPGSHTTATRGWRLAFGVHLPGHIVQWIVVGQYLPVAATSLVCLVYCGWGLDVMINSRLFTLREFVVSGAAGCAVAAANLWLLHGLAAKTADVSGRGNG